MKQHTVPGEAVTRTDVDLRASALSGSNAHKADYGEDSSSAGVEKPITPSEETLTKVGKLALANFLGLSVDNTQDLLVREVMIQRFATLARYDLGVSLDILEKMDTYGHGKDRAVVAESPKLREYLCRVDGLSMDGIVLSVDGRDVGAAFFYPVRNEYERDQKTMKVGLPEDLAACHKRSDWRTLFEKLGKIIGLDGAFPIEHAYHTYDYAVPLEQDRCKGYGQLAILIGRLNVIPTGNVAIGFIDSTNLDHLPSLIASMKAGTVIGSELQISPDGEHASFPSFFCAGMAKQFSGEKIISLADAKQDLFKFRDLLREVLNKNDQLVGFNHESRCFEFVKVDANQLQDPLCLIFPDSRR